MVDDYSPLMTAVMFGSELMLKPNVKNRAVLVNQKNMAGKSTLWYGVERNTYSMVRKLLCHDDFCPDLLHARSRTALSLAVSQGNKEIVSLLVLRGAKRDMKDEDGISPWNRACIRKRKSIKYLLPGDWIK